MRRSSNRRGITNVQWVVIAGAIVVVLFAAAQVIGTKTKNKMNETVTDVGDPKHLTTRWGKK